MDTTYKCDLCEYASTQPGTLATHERSHTGEMHNCDLCLLAFTTPGNLARHVRTHKMPYKCDLCGSEFTTPGNLARHEQRDHEKPRKCGLCELRFNCRDLYPRDLGPEQLDNQYKCAFLTKAEAREQRDRAAWLIHDIDKLYEHR